MNTSLHSLFALTMVFFAGCGDADLATGHQDVEPTDEARGPLGKADSAGSCVGTQRGEDFCGEQSADRCWCDDGCEDYGDCCSDYQGVCSCQALTCDELADTCGETDDGCGGVIDCGRCVSPTDPFDPASCEGAPLSKGQLAALFGAGETSTVLGQYQIALRKRSCNSVTGCGAWSPHNQLGRYQGTPLTGTARLLVRQSLIDLRLTGDTIRLEWAATYDLTYLLTADCRSVDPANIACEALYGHTGKYYGASSPGIKPIVAGDGAVPALSFQGEIRETCLRLTASRNEYAPGSQSWVEQNAALLMEL